MRRLALVSLLAAAPAAAHTGMGMDLRPQGTLALNVRLPESRAFGGLELNASGTVFGLGVALAVGWERAALTDGADGLDALRRIVAGAPDHLDAGGWLAMEHGWDQGAAVRALLAAAGFTEVRTVADEEGRERIGAGRLPGVPRPRPQRGAADRP